MKIFKRFQLIGTFVLRPSVLLLCLVSGIQIAGAKTEFIPLDRWYEVYLDGGKVGYFQDKMEKMEM